MSGFPDGKPYYLLLVLFWLECFSVYNLLNWKILETGGFTKLEDLPKMEDSRN